MVSARSPHCCVWVILVLAWLSALRPPPVWAVTYYVDANNPNARDTNPGSESQPWKTIGRATSVVNAGDTVLIKAGVYRETVTLSRSGTSTTVITFAAHPGHEGKVIINAAEPVTNWIKCSGPDDCSGNPNWSHIYWADVASAVAAHPDSDFAVRQVFQHGERLPRSRYPDTRWSYPTTIVDPRSTFIDSTLSKPTGYFTGAVCHIKIYQFWIEQVPIVSSSGSTIVVATNGNISTQFGYYITSVVGEINAEGEWAYDAVRKRLYLWPRGEVANNVEFTYRKNCLRTNDGVSYNIVRGLTMRYAYEHALWVCRANNITLVNNAIEYAFRYGIELSSTWAPCNDNQILRNTIKYCASRAMNVSEAAFRCKIEGNYVYATGVEHYGGDAMNGGGTGVYVVGPFARVYGNRIDRTGGTGLFLHGEALNREVCYNYITNSGLALADTSALYMAGRTEGTDKDYVHHNIIVDTPGCQMMEKSHDVGAPVTPERYAGMGTGIGVDEEANNRIVEDNTIIHSSWMGIGVHWSPGNLIQRNTLYGNGAGQIQLDGKNEEHKAIVDEVVLDNILFATDATQRTLYVSMDYNNVHFGQSDRNYFYNPYNYTHIFVSRYLTPYSGEHHDYLDLSGWQALSGYDSDSREFSYLDQFEDIIIDPEKKSRIIYNTSIDAINVYLALKKYCDVHGNKIYGSVGLQPFESKILISSDFEVPDGFTMLDFSFLVAHWLDDNCDSGNDYCEGMDLNESGKVDFDDFAIFAHHFELPARYPNPYDKAAFVSINADLSWTAGRGATSHDVYFGTSNPPPFILNQDATTFEPGTMDYITTYYWRIDEVNSAGTTTGTIWSFTTMMFPPP
jgi:parallel beta-helix repeat protein